MPDRAKYKSKGGDKDSAVKHTFDPPTGGGRKRDVEAKGPEGQDAKQRIGQYGDAGEPPLIKQ